MALRPTIYSSISRAIGSTVLGGGFSGLLDQYPGASAAYSLRALSAGWLASDVVEVRRSSDSATDTFTASQITGGDLLAFCGVGDGFVSTWYDQSGNGYDATQATTTAQPKIVDAGVLVADGIDFDGVDDQLMVIGNPVITADFSGTFSTFSVQAVASTEGGYLFGCASASGGTSQYATSASRYTTSSGSSSALDRIFRASDSNLLSSVYDSGNAGLLVNGGDTMTDQGVYNFAAGTVDFTIGNRSGGSSSLTFMKGKVNEIIVYNSNQSINRSDIESEIMTNYGL